VNIPKLPHHPKNQEIYDLYSIEELMDSISELGLLQSFIIDQYHKMISGNLSNKRITKNFKLCLN
jgi:hypothetical protein